MITSIHHVALLISSEKTLDFYKILGFEEVYRKERKSDTVVLLDGFGMQLEVFVDDRHPVRVRDLSEPLGTRHFALKVNGRLEDEIKRLTEVFISRLKFDPEFEEIAPDWTGIRYVFFRDPDGNVLELHE